MDHPFHEHPVAQVDAQYAYFNTGGEWQCNICSTKFGSSQSREHSPYHCPLCDFNICTACFSSAQTHPLHCHPLTKVSASAAYQGGLWKCNRYACVRSGENDQIYHCDTCDFDLCDECFHSFSHPLHQHPLLYADTQMLCEQDELERWQCSNCKEHYATGMSRHCPMCRIHLCNDCVTGVSHVFHADHQLLRADSRVVYSDELYGGRWFCDNCKRDDGGHTFMWHCQQCHFDLCHKCVREGGDQDECRVCMDHLCNAKLTHGEDKYCALFCMECAKKVKDSGQPCPLCRRKIEDVVHVTVSQGPKHN